MMKMMNRFRFHLCWLVVLAALAGCQWPMDTKPARKLRFEGSVKSAQTGAPVAGAQVQVWLRLPDELGSAPPFAEGATDAAGSFAFEREYRSRGIPPDLTLRVTPPAATGLAGYTMGGFFSEVFSDVTVYEELGRRYRTNVQLAPAP